MVKEMCGASGGLWRVPPKKEIYYINEHVRGLFARKDLVKGEPINLDTCYMAVPVHKGQLSCREVLSGGTLKKAICQDEAIMHENVDAEYLSSNKVRDEIDRRGMDRDKLSDYIVKFLEGLGIDTVFLVTGGGAMHLNDSFGQSERMRKVYNHHEQACAIAAEGYSRASGRLSVVNVTTGPGGLNALNGVFGQWDDSVPVLYVSGQVRYDTTVESLKGRLDMRQMGDQEVDIIEVVKPLTKYAAMIKDPKDVKWVLGKAVHEATYGRPGPVWIDVPHNIQSALVDEDGLQGFDAGGYGGIANRKQLQSEVEQVANMLATSKRPIFVVGHGVRLSKTIGLVRNLAIHGHSHEDHTNGFESHRGYVPPVRRKDRDGGAEGWQLRPSECGSGHIPRNEEQHPPGCSYTWKYYARAARRVIVDIDYNELRKPTITYELAVHADLRDFLPLLHNAITVQSLGGWKDWNEWCQERRRRFPVVTQEQMDSNPLNPYHFTNVLTQRLYPDAVVVAGNGTVSLGLFQSGIVKAGQRMFINSGCASMGYDVPASIGAACAVGRDVVCLAGDGSFQMNLQEMATIAHNRFPVKIFYYDNGGYASIRQTQDNFFGRRFGIDQKTGVAFPNTSLLMAAYGIPFREIKGKEGMEEVIDEVLCMKGPVFCHVHLDPTHIFEPKLSSERKPDGQARIEAP